MPVVDSKVVVEILQYVPVDGDEMNQMAQRRLFREKPGLPL